MNIILDTGARAYNNCVCPVCGKEFHLKPYRIARSKNNYCSVECHRVAKREYMSGDKNHQFGLKGNLNSSWKEEERKTSRYGYWMIRMENHPFADSRGWVFEHRRIAEQNLLFPECTVEINGNKYLSPDYVVHHKNFDRKDNRVENLEIMTREHHQSYHASLNQNPRDELGRYKKTEDLIKIKKLSSSAIIPELKTVGAAGYDLAVDIEEPITIKPHETVMLPSNIAFEIPNGYFGAVYARSGISSKRGLRPATCVSVIDSDYRGGVGLPIHNDTDEERVVEPHERVAQIVFQKCENFALREVENFSASERGANGFGSTGR